MNKRQLRQLTAEHFMISLSSANDSAEIRKQVIIKEKLLTLTRLTPKQATQPKPPSGAILRFACFVLSIFFACSHLNNNSVHDETRTQ